LELVVIFEPISSSDNYDPTSIPGSSIPVMAGERTHSRAREQRPSHIPIQNVDVDVDEDDEEEEWHLDVEEDDIQDATDINMNEIDDAADVEGIVKEWQMYVPFINRGMKHPCAQFADNTLMSYVDEPYFRKPPRIDEQFGVGQQFSTKLELKVKIVDFHVQRNIELEVTNSSKSKLVMKCKDSNCPWRMYATPNMTGIWEIRTNPLEHSYFGSATKAGPLACCLFIQKAVLHSVR
jgi:MuDR family transposase